jgi:DNA polymerase-3 subunit delta
MGFSEDRAQGKFGPSYLLIAENPFVLWDAQEQWKSAWRAAAKANLPVLSFTAPQIDIDRLRNAGMTMPMFETLQLVMVQGVDRIGASKQDEFLACLRALSPSTKILLTAEAFDRRTSFYKSLSTLCDTESFKPIYEEHIPGWVRRIVSDLDWSISSAAVELIAAVHGTDLFGVRQIIERATLYIGAKRRIEVADVEIVMAGEGEHDVYQLLDVASRRDLEAALRKARALWANGDRLTLWLSAIYGQCIRLFRFLDAAGDSDEELGRALHMHPFIVKKTRPVAMAYGYEGLTGAIDAVFETDWAVKTSTLPPAFAWELFVWRLAGGSKRLNKPLFDLETPRLRE